MSLRLLLEDFLGLMREEGELDVYLPLLLSAMGHEIIFRAQKGPRQFGVDVVTVGTDTDGHRKLFLWLIKCGDIGRAEWSAGEQSVRQSIEDVGDVYLQSHVAPQHAKLRKKLVVLTNGEFKSTIAQTLAAYLSTWSSRHDVEADHVNGSTLAAWTEAHLLDEHALPPNARTLFRRMLANISTPEVCIQVGRSLIEILVTEGLSIAKSKNAQRKRHLTALRAVRTALSILYVWGQNEDNLVAPYRLSEFALLAIWSGFQEEIAAGNKPVISEFSEVLFQVLNVGHAYHEKLHPFYCVKDAFAYTSPDSILVAERVFEELGRLGFCGYTWAFHAVVGDVEFAADQALVYAARIEALLTSHDCVASPVYDHQALDVHAALLCLLSANHIDAAKQWLANIVRRLLQVSGAKKYWPLVATFQEALEVHHGYEEVGPELVGTSILVPLLAIWTSALGMDDAYAALRDKLLPKLSGTTLNIWSSDVGFDRVLSDPMELQAHGVGEALLTLPSDPRQLLTELASPLPGVESIERSQWYQSRVPYIPLIAALHWRLQVPREMLAKHAVALAPAGAPAGD